MFASVADLERALSDPSPGLVEDLAALTGDIAVLGAGGKMGPSLCRLARRGLDEAGRKASRVIAVSRWSDKNAQKELDDAGVETASYDLSPDADLQALPDAENVVYMVGAKFGSSGRPEQTWAVNALLPWLVAKRYATSRIAAFSTGNVYPLVPVSSGGSTEKDPPDPVGEYAMSCLGRERLLTFASAEHGTRLSIIRLNYAVDLRYGVLADIGRAVHAGEPIDVTTGHANVVWQGYANEVTLRSLTHASNPPFVINLTGPEILAVRRIAEEFGTFFGRTPEFEGAESPTALLSNASLCHSLFGYPSMSSHTLISAQADWLDAGLPLLDKPTKFQRRDGRF